MINHTGRVVIEPQSGQPFNFSEGLTVVQQNRKIIKMDYGFDPLRKHTGLAEAKKGGGKR